MDTLEAMTLLIAAVDAGSLSGASRRLRVPLTTVSRRIAELEKRLNVRLLHRGSRKVVLTEAGQRYVTSCRRVVEEIAEIERTASGEYSAPQGELTISAPAVLGRMHVLPVLQEFLGSYPEIRARLELTDRYVSLLDEHVDAVVRVGELTDSSMISTRVGLIRLVVCASPAYLKKRGEPSKPVDLAKHDCVVHETHSGSNNWDFVVGKATRTILVPSRLSVTLGEAAVAAAVKGGGVVRVLSYLVEDLLKTRSLVALLEAYEPAPLPVSVVYPGQRQVPVKLRAFLDFALPRLRKRLSMPAPADTSHASQRVLRVSSGP